MLPARLALSCLVLAACGGSNLAARAPIQVTQTVPVIYSKNELAPGKRLPLPLIEVEIGGKKTLAIVDTGAQVSVLAYAFAGGFAEAPPGPPAPIGRDSSGKTVTLQRLLNVSVIVPGLGTIAIPDTVRTQLPLVFEQLGIGMILSPQALASTQRSVLLDLRGGKFGWVAPGTRPGRGLSVRIDACTYEESGVRARALLVASEVEGIATTLAIDTGASDVSLKRTSKAGAALEKAHDIGTSRTLGAGGVATSGEVKSVAMLVDSTLLKAHVTLTDSSPNSNDEPCKHDGLVGMRFLKSCTLVISPTGVDAHCDPPSL